MLSNKFCDTVNSKFLFISMYCSATRNGWIEVAIGEMFVSIYFMFQRFLISFIGLFLASKSIILVTCMFSSKLKEVLCDMAYIHLFYVCVHLCLQACLIDCLQANLFVKKKL